jgi:hypothetical protein
MIVADLIDYLLDEFDPEEEVVAVILPEVDGFAPIYLPLEDA